MSMKTLLTALLAAMTVAVAGCAKKLDNFEKTGDGVIVSPVSGPAKRVRLQVMSDRVVRVTAVPAESLELPESLAVIAKAAGDVKFDVATTDSAVSVRRRPCASARRPALRLRMFCRASA